MKNKKLTLTALIIAVLSLSIGFAAFSNSLNIKSSANVNPNEDDFGVVFSKEKDSVVDGKVVVASQNTTGNESGVGTIVNNAGAPEISGLSAEFTAPGQQVVYEFYVKNVGSYNAYLTELIFGDGKSFITCTPSSDATKDLVDKACEGIKVFVNIENESKVFTSDTLVNTLDNHMISKGASEKVTVTLSYLEGSEVADGDFTVTFGDIGSTYATVKNFTKPVTPVENEICFYTYTDSEDGDTLGIAGYNANCGKDAVIPSNLPLIKIATLDTEACISGFIGKGIKEEYATSYCQVDSEILVRFLALHNLTDVATYTQSSESYTVTSIGFESFAYKGLTSVTLPDTLTKIESDAFAFNNLTSVIIPDGVGTIGSYAFSNNNISTVIIGSGISDIGREAFGAASTDGYGPNVIENVTINAAKNDVTLRDDAFGWISGKSDNDINWQS